MYGRGRWCLSTRTQGRAEIQVPCPALTDKEGNAMTRKLTPEDRLRDQSPVERLNNQLVLGQCRIGHDAAREIARRITGEHGFWDYEERKRAAQPAQIARPVLTLVPDEQSAEMAA